MIKIFDNNRYVYIQKIKVKHHTAKFNKICCNEQMFPICTFVGFPGIRN